MNTVPPPLYASDAALDLTLMLSACAAVLLLSWSLVDGARRHTWVPFFAFAGGVCSLPIEAFWDVNVQFSFATNSEPIAYTAFDREIPLYLTFIYPAFIGWGSYLTYRLMKSGTSARVLWTAVALAFVGDAVIEIVGIHADLWQYYGDHAFAPASWPVCFGVLNATITLLGGWLLVLAERHLQGEMRAGLLLVVPTAYVGIYAVAGWPTWVALNSDVPRLLVWAATATTMAIALGVCRLVIHAVTGGGRDSCTPQSADIHLDAPQRTAKIC